MGCILYQYGAWNIYVGVQIREHGLTTVSICKIVGFLFCFILDLMHMIEQLVYEWRRAEQYGGGWAEWHHTEIIDYCPVTMAEEEKEIRLCIYVCVCVYNCWKKVFNTFWCIGLECALFTSYYLSGTFSALNHFIFQLPTIHTYWTETEQRKTHTHTKSEGSAAKQMYTLHGFLLLLGD